MFLGLPTLVAGMLADPSFSVVLTDATPKFTNFGFGVTTLSLLKFIPSLELTSILGLPMILQPTNLLKLGLVPLFLSKIINGSFEFLGVSDPLRTRRPYWIKNILCHSPCWGVRGTVENLNWGSQTDGCYGSVGVPWHGAVPARLAYLPRSPENVSSTLCHIRDDLL